mmetsp:Transcript_40039/g.90045  ORF Transcript_40039/g.90045 Transcript_40039/m.90045 type:complete len:220 (+) Transcript_40039:2-661(+)
MKKLAKKKRKAVATASEPKLSAEESELRKHRPAMDVAEKEALIQKALAEVEAGLAQAVLKKGRKGFLPANWAKEYKPALGPYKMFLKQHPERFHLTTDAKGDFVVKRPGEAGAVGEMWWQKDLLKAWTCYCEVTQQPARDLKAFLMALPKSARAGMSLESFVSPTVKPAPVVAGSPKMVPLPKAASGKKRRKVRTEKQGAPTEKVGKKLKVKKKKRKSA